MTGCVVSFLLGLGLGGPTPCRPDAAGLSAEELPEAVQESVTGFEEEVAALGLEADRTDATPDAMADQSRARGHPW
ncbi:hypothetical protein [Streptomyces sp. NPDC004728]|uniref:hypothetical protein n=1 Tax=Streptomyces sp. NPDC004728 TaxID=3154289 RepID=UPI0033B71771